MYIPPLFKAGQEEALAFALERGFGTLIAVADGKPVAAYLPFVQVENADRVLLQCHVARGNPIHAAIAKAPDVLLTIAGADAYVSPDWYLSPDQVPTWNYVSVQLTGHAHVLPAEHLRAHVDAVSAHFETQLLPKKPWTSEKMTAARLEAMLKAIVGIEIEVTSIEGAWKLSQNKSRGDRIAVAEMLRWRGSWQARGVSELMNAGLRAGAKEEAT